MQEPSTLLDPYVSAQPPRGAPESQRTVGGAGAGAIPREDPLSLGLGGNRGSTLFQGHSDCRGSNPETSRKQWVGLEGEPRLHHLIRLFAQRAHCTSTTGLVLGTWSSQGTVHSPKLRSSPITSTTTHLTPPSPRVWSPPPAPPAMTWESSPFLGLSFLICTMGGLDGGGVHVVQQLKAEQVCVCCRGSRAHLCTVLFALPRSASKACTVPYCRNTAGSARGIFPVRMPCGGSAGRTSCGPSTPHWASSFAC